MFKRAIKRLLAKRGYAIRKIPQDRDERPGYTLYKYLKDDGSFDYEKYRRIQTEGNKRKIEMVWVFEENIIFLSDYIRRMIGQPRFGLCHGTRRGNEQEWFRKHLGCEVLGTEISETAEQFPHTLRWDFHEVKPEWLEACDFIYSNAFDHSYDPEKCLEAWMSCIRQGGLCLLEQTSWNGPGSASELDPFGADITLMPYLITMWAKGKYGVREIIDTPERQGEARYSKFIVIQKF